MSYNIEKNVVIISELKFIKMKNGYQDWGYKSKMDYKTFISKVQKDPEGFFKLLSGNPDTSYRIEFRQEII